MKGLSEGVDLLLFEKDLDSDSEWYYCEVGVDGAKAAFSVPTSYVLEMFEQGEQVLGEYLERQARNYIERYGDARDPRPDPVLLSESAA